MSTQGASVQWLHRITENKRRELGNSPFSTCLTQVRLTPTGTLCSDLQAVVQAWHPIHLRLSMTNPYFIFCGGFFFQNAVGRQPTNWSDPQFDHGDNEVHP